MSDAVKPVAGTLRGKTIVLGITGGIAAYKAAQLASDLVKTGADVHVIMTQNATEFVSPVTFETLTANRVSVDTFDRNFQWNVQHISLAKKADLFVVAPASANSIAKMAFGLADDMLSTTILAATCPKLVVPAMNTGMYDNAATQRNFSLLKEMGIHFVDSDTGWLACGDVGKGRFPELAKIMDAIFYILQEKRDLVGKKVLVTAGPTRESLDPVRFISNHSTGKMGYAIAREARMRGAEVTLISGPVAITPPIGVALVSVSSALEMYEEVMQRSATQDMIIKTAAVADYRPESYAEDKIKKADGDMQIRLVRNPDILKAVGENKPKGQILCGFSMETKDLISNSTAKLTKKNADMIVANNLKTEGAGFGVDTNIVTLITKEEVRTLPKMTKQEVAQAVLDALSSIAAKGE